MRPFKYRNDDLGHSDDDRPLEFGNIIAVITKGLFVVCLMAVVGVLFALGKMVLAHH